MNPAQPPLPPPPSPQPKLPRTDTNKPPLPKVIRPGAIPYDRRKRKSFSWPIAIFVFLSTTMLFILIMAAYLFFYQPRIVLADYVRKLADVKTGTATGSLSFKNSAPSKLNLNQETIASLSKNASQLLTQADITFNLRYNIRDVSDPMFDTKFTLAIAGVTSDVDTIIDNKSLYLRLEDNPLISLAGASISHNWFRMPLPENTFKKSTCTLQDQEHSILSRNVLRFMPVKSVRRKKLYEVVKGHRTVHTTGEVNMEKLGQAIEQANSNLPEQCRIIFDPRQAKNTSAFYDLYSSRNFDRLSVTVIDHNIGRESDVIMDTEHYGTDINITSDDTAQTIHSITDILKPLKSH